jgi:hypothetical protein
VAGTDDDGPGLTLADLTANGTITAEGAGILRDIGRRGEGFIVYSLPRNAGKSTVTTAILAEAPAGLARHDFLGTVEERDALLDRRADGYLVVAEMGHRGRPGYLAAEEIERAFDVVAHGYPLATSLHADDVAQLFDVLARNGIPPATAAGAVRHLVKVQPLGDPFDPSTRRIVEHIREITGVDADGMPTTRLRYEAPGR